MFKFPGENTNTLTINGKPYKEIKYPTPGSICKGRVLKTTLLLATIEIFEVEGSRTLIPYTGLIKLQDINTKTFIPDLIKVGEEIECTIVSFCDIGVYLVKN